MTGWQGLGLNHCGNGEETQVLCGVSHAGCGAGTSLVDVAVYLQQGDTSSAQGRVQSHRSELNRRPLDYESRALPLSYGGWFGFEERMPWPGFEPGRIAPLPPQDSVSTSSTTRAGMNSLNVVRFVGKLLA